MARFWRLKMQQVIWIFMAPQATFPSGVFSKLNDAEEWIAQHQLTGVLTEYPIDVGVYDWAIETGKFKPKPEKKIDAKFIGKFTTALMSHYHYEDGQCLG